MYTERGSETERSLRNLAGETEGAIARLMAERARLDAEPEPGLTAEDAGTLEKFAAEIRAGVEHATPLDQRDVYRVLKLRATVRKDTFHERRRVNASETNHHCSRDIISRLSADYS